MRILVTGGAGYVGSSLVPALIGGGHHVRVLDRLDHGGAPLLSVWSSSNFEFLRGDIRDCELVGQAVAGMDAVVHLAAIVGDPACARQPDLARSVNLDASIRLIEASREAGVRRFVFASTCSNYGKMTDISKLADEETQLRPVSLYAEVKVAVERALLDSHPATGWCPTPLRFATVFGVSPRMRFDLTINEFTMEMIANKKLVVFGEQFWRPYVHVVDAGRAIKLVLEQPEEKVAGQVFNVGDTNQNFQKQQLVDMIRPLAPEAVVEVIKKTEDPRDYRVSFEKIGKQLGFAITRTVAEGIADVARLIRQGVIVDFTNVEYRN
jgi:nucleoside-diphosphate-sugar epimerase